MSFAVLLFGAWPAAATGGRPPSPSAHGPPRRFGATFSHHVLGSEWKRALDETDGLGLDLLRIGAYWSDIEERPGIFSWRTLDAVLDAAEAKGYRVLLTVGMKAPRWPEYYLPSWAPGPLPAAEGAFTHDSPVAPSVIDFVRETVAHCSTRTAIVAWQVENEPLDRAGPHRWRIGPKLLSEEIAAARHADRGHRRVVVNCWSDDEKTADAPWPEKDGAGFKEALAAADVLGLDVYKAIGTWGTAFFERRCVEIPEQELAAARAAHEHAWITECQAEDWPPAKIDPATVEWLVHRQETTGYRTIILWGLETWYRLRHSPDPAERARGEALWRTVQDLARTFHALP